MDTVDASEDLLNKLLGKDVLSLDECDIIKVGEDNWGRVHALLIFISCKSREQCQLFSQAIERIEKCNVVGTVVEKEVVFNVIF